MKKTKIKLCECGCGNQIQFKEYHKKKGTPKFILGHHIRISHPSQIPKIMEKIVNTRRKSGWWKNPEKTKRKISLAKKGTVPWMKGKTHSEETKRKIGEANKGNEGGMLGKNHSEKSKKSMSLSHKGKYISIETREKISAANQGKKNSNWKGGRNKNSKGYIDVHSSNHPCKDARGMVREHRLIMEKHLKRYLNKSEVVHHIDRNKQNNYLSNLMIFQNNSAHIKFHMEINKRLST